MSIRAREPYSVAMTVPFVLLVFGALAAATAPRLLSRAEWPDREPVLALWVWQCVVAAVLLSCVLAMALFASAASAAVRWHVFALAPPGVVDAYGLTTYVPWAGALAILLAGGAARTATMLTREVLGARALRRRQRAGLLERSPLLPGEDRTPRERLVLVGREALAEADRSVHVEYLVKRGPSQIRVDEQHAPLIGLAERQGEVRCRKRLALARQRAREHDNLEPVFGLSLMQRGGEPPVLLARARQHVRIDDDFAGQTRAQSVSHGAEHRRLGRRRAARSSAG